MKRQTAAYVRTLLDKAKMNQIEAAKALSINPRTLRRYVSRSKSQFQQPPMSVVLALEFLATRK